MISKKNAVTKLQGGGKALVAGPLEKILFVASLTYLMSEVKRRRWLKMNSRTESFAISLYASEVLVKKDSRSCNKIK